MNFSFQCNRPRFNFTITSVLCAQGRVTRLISGFFFFRYLKVVGHSACNFNPFRCRSCHVRVRVWWRVYPFSHPQGYFPYVIHLRLMFCLCRKPHWLASRAFLSTCVYKVRVFRIHCGSVTRPISREFVHPSAKVHGTIKSVVQSCVRSTSFVKATGFLTSTFNWYYLTQSDSHSFYPALSSVVVRLKFVSITVPIRIQQHKKTDPAAFRYGSSSVNIFSHCQRSSVLLFDNKCCPPASAVFSSTLCNTLWVGSWELVHQQIL